MEVETKRTWTIRNRSCDSITVGETYDRHTISIAIGDELIHLNYREARRLGEMLWNPDLLEFPSGEEEEEN